MLIGHNWDKWLSNRKNKDKEGNDNKDKEGNDNKDREGTGFEIIGIGGHTERVKGQKSVQCNAVKLWWRMMIMLK